MDAGGAQVETQAVGGIDKLLGFSIGGTETFSLGSMKQLDKYPIGIPRMLRDHGYTTLHAVGLGTNSTLLNTLIEAGEISARAWSIFWGRMWVDEEDAYDGSVVLGGYDQDKVIGTNYTQPLDFSDITGCWTGMKVSIRSVKLNFRDGSDYELLDPSTVIDACLVPQLQLLLEVPRPVVRHFEEYTTMQNIGPSYGLHWSAFLYDETSEWSVHTINPRNLIARREYADCSQQGLTVI